jgi:hypothetical protein
MSMSNQTKHTTDPAEHYGSLYTESIAAQEAKDDARFEAIADLDAEIALEQEEREGWWGISGVYHEARR